MGAARRPQENLAPFITLPHPFPLFLEHSGPPKYDIHFQKNNQIEKKIKNGFELKFEKENQKKTSGRFAAYFLKKKSTKVKKIIGASRRNLKKKIKI